MTNLSLIDDDAVEVGIRARGLKTGNIANPLSIPKDGLEAWGMLHNDGNVEFLPELRAEPKLKNIPVVVLTASNEEKDKVLNKLLTLAGFIVKAVICSLFAEDSKANVVKGNG